MQNQMYRLIFPPNLLDVPIINDLIRKYNLTVNIIRAHVTPTEGWVDIHISGSAGSIESATNWLQSQGVQVESLTN